MGAVTDLYVCVLEHLVVERLVAGQQRHDWHGRCHGGRLLQCRHPARLVRQGPAHRRDRFPGLLTMVRQVNSELPKRMT
jgi:hypothetical protein